MKKIFKDIVNNKGEKYSVILILKNEQIIDMLCDCRYMSFDFWTKTNQIRKSVCRHILQAIAEEKLTLPVEYQTERNLKLIKKFK